MDHLQRLSRQVKRYVFGVMVANSVILVGALWVGMTILHLQRTVLFITLIGAVLIVSMLLAGLVTTFVTEPVKFLWQAILHVSPDHSQTPAPNFNKSRVGRELITSLCLQIYQLASLSENHATSNTNNDSWAKNIISNLPLPVFVMDRGQSVTFANEAARRYIGLKVDGIIGKDMYSLLNLSFPSSHTLDGWLADSRVNKVTASASWDRVRLKLPERREPLQFDMAAYYSKDSPMHVESVIVMFDHTKRYQQDDQDIGFIALAVHELRTPLTLLRGYMEVFEEELGSKLDSEMADFLRKMRATAQQLTAFVNNILNAARIEADQLVMQLHKERWADIVQAAINDLSLRAQVHKKQIEYTIAANLPAVGADRVSMYEVMNNLLDNAIKYSDKSQKIIVKSYLRDDGLVETTVQDFGVGIDESVLPNLFEKFYRNHRTQQQVGGTGLGLYLSKAIVTAHGGNIWVRSKEGKGTIFGFTLQPYSMLAEELKNSDNKDIVKGAHGWIKNHSLYRR